MTFDDDRRETESESCLTPDADRGILDVTGENFAKCRFCPAKFPHYDLLVFHAQQSHGYTYRKIDRQLREVDAKLAGFVSVAEEGMRGHKDAPPSNSRRVDAILDTIQDVGGSVVEEVGLDGGAGVRR